MFLSGLFKRAGGLVTARIVLRETKGVPRKEQLYSKEQLLHLHRTKQALQRLLHEFP